MPLAAVVSSGISRPVTVTCPAGGAGTLGNVVCVGASAGIQPRLTSSTLPSVRRKG